MPNEKISKLELEELKKTGGLNNTNLEKLNNGYPIQYLIGYVNFYGLKIFVSEDTLIPRYETEYLIEKVIKCIKKYNFDSPNILDLCTGSGCIGLTLKHEIPKSSVDLSDISSSALKIATKNKENLKLDVNIYQSDLFKSLNKKDYDIIISNPPYVMTTENLPIEVKYEPKIALYSGDKGITHIEQIIKEYLKYTKDKSILALEINEKSENDITKIIENNLNFEKNIKYTFEKDLAQKIRYLFIFKNCE